MSKMEYMPVDCLQVPKVLFQMEKYKNLSNTAKILYSLFLDRLKFAVQNDWVDVKGNLYVIYPKSEMKKDLNTTRYGVDQAVQELVDVGNLVRIIPNNGKANHFYINDIYENEMEEESMMTLDSIMANMPMEEREIIMDKMVKASRDILETIADMGYLNEYETPLTSMEERNYRDELGQLDVDQISCDGYEFGMDVGELFGNMSLDDIFERFNIDRPEDFRGHSLSVSDIVVLNDGENVTAHFVDSISFEQLDHFLELEEQSLSELAYEVGERYFAIQTTEEGYDYSFYDEDFRLMDGGVYENGEISIEEAAEELLEDEGWTGERIRGDYDQLMEKVEEMDEANYNMIDNVLNNMPLKKEPYLEYFATECDEFHDMGAYEKSTDVNQIAAVYEKYKENPETAYLGCSMGIIYRDPEDSYYDDAEFAIVKGNTVLGNLMDDVRFYGELALVREGIEKIHEALPDYKYVPMRDVREAMYPEKMTTEQLAEAMDEIAEAFDPYEYRDNVERGENTVQEVMLDLQSGNIYYYVSYLKDIVDEECDLSVRAGVLMERLKAYEPELPKDMEPMVYVNYCEKSELGKPRCQKLSDLDSRTIEQDKAWYADRDPNTNELKTTAQMFFTVYYAEKGDKMLHHFKGKIDIGTGNGGLLSQLKLQNEMRLTDESWINYQKGKGNEEFQKYMEDLTDMRNHVLPYLQSFCSLEEKGVQERREQKIAEKNESREAVPRVAVEINTAVKDAGKTERKAVAQKKTMPEKEKKPSIHERLEINKRIIQEKQGKDKPERGADLGVRTV